MAEIYPPGDNRIFYHIRGDSDGVTIKVDLLDPDLNNHTNIKELIPVVGVKGLYYFNFTFREGSYFAVYREIRGGETIRKWSQAYSIRKDSLEPSFQKKGNLLNL